ncbi:RimK family protein [Natronoflexus pectinivorans]|uniref:Glutathione synthase/RimK-type ligase-like ATP-grasp enzyme n=1 Tax=Natronoflexus pectinivorans TaxID=682526 RepID=A0A4R2GJX0_9BACT|nr:RimK family protein [Natronoflexus pectinivorans]TCO09113.1 glutathione synthase/RimK-type ligase-like ATP-grasp enzyme [Natronoflexus pectinivorans]
MRKIIVINNPQKWVIDIPGVEVIAPRTYLEDENYAKLKGARVFNLCYDYAYQTRGYYVSLLAEARGQKVIPSVKKILDLKSQAIVKLLSDVQDALIQKTLRHIRSKEFVLSVYFGRNVSSQYDKLAKELYKLFQVPFLRARFTFDGKKWEIQSVKTIPYKEIPEHHLEYLDRFARDYFGQKRYDQARVEKHKYDLAILVNPDEKSPPSNRKAIGLFVEAAEKAGCYVELITKDDFHRIGEFDALFIRETTSVNHHTYKMARRAQSEGLAVIDSPESILKCANKVYLAEILQLARIPTPKTIIIHTENVKGIEHQLGFPCVLKLPDSSFSQGVVKVETPEQMREKVKEMMKVSDLLIAQEFLPTDYDWRVGVLNNKVIFVCRYYMARNHWQIYNWQSDKKREVSGGFDILEPDDAPSSVKATALKATRLIGNGLYGVDIKEVKGKAFVIEINDNPNIDAGVEDLLLKEKLYQMVMEHLINSIEE